MNVSPTQCAGLLLLWLEKQCSPEACKALAKDIGFNDSPIFGADKRRVRLVGEIAIANTALVIHAVNCVFGHDGAKAIIDLFLEGARQSIFCHLEQKDPGFKARYEQRVAQYFDALRGDKPGIGASFLLMRALDRDPLKNLPGQMAVAIKLGESLSSTAQVLKSVSVHQVTGQGDR